MAETLSIQARDLLNNQNRRSLIVPQQPLSPHSRSHPEQTPAPWSRFCCRRKKNERTLNDRQPGLPGKPAQAFGLRTLLWKKSLSDAKSRNLPRMTRGVSGAFVSGPFFSDTGSALVKDRYSATRAGVKNAPLVSMTPVSGTAFSALRVREHSRHKVRFSSPRAPASDDKAISTASASERQIGAGRKIGGRSLAVAVRLSPFDKLRTPWLRRSKGPERSRGAHGPEQGRMGGTEDRPSAGGAARPRVTYVLLIHRR